jgi:hypothetical protein
VPIEETVRAFNYVLDKGWAFYWGTSEWSAREIEEAHHVATRLGLVGPVAEQCKHHMLDRTRPEEEYAPLYRKYGMGTTVFSALAGGLLTGKYNQGVPEGSRFEKHGELPFIKSVVDSFGNDEGQKTIKQLQELNSFAEKGPRRFLSTGECTRAHAARRAELHDHPARARMGRGESEHVDGHPRRVQAGADPRQPQGDRRRPEADAGRACPARRDPWQQARGAGDVRPPRTRPDGPQVVLGGRCRSKASVYS